MFLPLPSFPRGLLCARGVWLLPFSVGRRSIWPVDFWEEFYTIPCPGKSTVPCGSCQLLPVFSDPETETESFFVVFFGLCDELLLDWLANTHKTYQTLFFLLT